jgi:hypothetical protein
MVPDAWEPTCTVVTALMVPVAWTTFCTSPFCTFSVKYCGALGCSSLNAASPAMAASSTPMIVHLFFRYFILTPEVLLRLYRVQTPGWEDYGKE